MKFEMSDDMIEQRYNFDNLIVVITRCDNKFKINIDDTNCKYNFNKLPYAYIALYNKIFKRYSNDNMWWCYGLWKFRKGNGNIDFNDTFTSYEIQTILDAIENGINEMRKVEKLHQKPEIIKIENVTITKRYVDKDHVSLDVEGLLDVCQYPSTLSNGYVAYMVGDDEFTLCSEPNKWVNINNRVYFPTRNFVVTNSDAEKIINIITKSEKKLKEYNAEPKYITRGFDINKYDIHVKIEPYEECDCKFYKIYIDIPDSIKEKMNNNPIKCNVKHLDGKEEIVNIRFNKITCSVSDWKLAVDNFICSYSFSNGNDFTKTAGEQTYSYICAYLTEFVKQLDEIKVGDTVHPIHALAGFKLKVIATDGEWCWCKDISDPKNDYRYSYEKKYLEKIG